MSRASTAQARNPSLTEELEKLEQQITLTLQEIDHNFNRAHRIVTSSILPVVEQYAEHSKAVWEGSKFWKQFFEASANVSLSGYEEKADDEEEEDSALSQSRGNNSTFANSTIQQGEESRIDQGEYDETEDSLLDGASVSGSTPRAPKFKSGAPAPPKFANYGSPYEEFKQELKGGSTKVDDEADVTQLAPTTPARDQLLPDMSMTPASSPFAPQSHLQSTIQRGKDPLLHRILDKNYRLQATPHTTRKEKAATGKPAWRDSTSPQSSPPIAPPQMRSDIFSSPVRQQYTRAVAPRTPGVSVQTPAKNMTGVPRTAEKKDEISWESDSDDGGDDIYKELGMSPPKTIQFYVPQSKLLQTPAREASKRILEDLLTTAGANEDDGDDSPSIVKMQSVMDDTF